MRPLGQRELRMGPTAAASRRPAKRRPRCRNKDAGRNRQKPPVPSGTGGFIQFASACRFKLRHSGMTHPPQAFPAVMTSMYKSALPLHIFAAEK